MTTSTGRALAVTAAIALALGLAACGPDALPEPSAEPAPETPVAVLNDEQLQRILGSVSETLVAADAASAADQLEGRVSGPARTMREAEYALAAATGGANTVTPLATDAQVAIVAATSEWPRLANVVTTIPEGTNLPLLITLVQDNARANYQLWSWVRLLPGVQLPATVNPTIGSPVIAADSDALRTTPALTLERYADVLGKGDGSEFAAEFAADVFRTKLRETFTALSTGVSQAGTAEQTATVRDAGVQSLGTNDGGAIVVGAIDQTLTIKRTVADSTLEVGGGLTYGGDAQVKGTLTATYVITVAFHVPPAGSDQPTQVLGAEQVLTGVTRDDSTSPD